MRNQFLHSTIFEKEEDCKNNPFLFEKFNLGLKKDEYPSMKFSGPLFKKSKNSESELKEKYFIYTEQRSLADTQERGILNIKYCRLKKMHFTDEGGNYVYGFILMGKGNQIEFYHQNKKHIEQWIDILKDSVILVDLKEDYTIGSLIGKGNFAKVHLCRRKTDDKSFALKSVEKALIRKSKRNAVIIFIQKLNQIFQSSILLEIDILRQIQHDHIIKLYEVYESDKYIHLVFEYLEGGELFERIKSKGLYQEKDAINVMRNLLQALDYLHQRGIVHRDLKPENLILASKDNDYNLKIADFGLASFMEKGQLLFLRCGSPGYVAPELLEDKGYYTKADIFSAGVILYVMLTGRPAFPGGNIHEILMKNKRGDVQYPPKYWEKISVEAKDLVGKMLQKDPRNRINAKEALQHQWFNTENTNNNALADFRENIILLEQEMQLDTKDFKSEDINMITCTPVLAGRGLDRHVPQSPFLTNNSHQRDNTPMLRFQMRQNGDSEKINLVGGIMMRRVLAPETQQKANGNELPQIPQYRKGGPQNPQAQARSKLASLEKKPQDDKNFVIKVQAKQNPAVENVQNRLKEEEKASQINQHASSGQQPDEQNSPQFAHNYNPDGLSKVHDNMKKKGDFNYNSDEEIDYYNIKDEKLLETFNTASYRNQQIKPFQPGNFNDLRMRSVPTILNKSQLSRINRPSKKRVTISEEEIKALGELWHHQQSDVGGDGGNVYLLDYEELKKVMNDATGSSPQKMMVAGSRNMGSSAAPLKNNLTIN
ncbi:protein kinase domain containing protein [Stylonychia lemnae]|uniref:Protein kinase domain containing protein n=1 Tax=Stylonychia lemnae TaxID=5949 RepID=A0A078AND8_STYLE|nr:protein kinase domain containing protein [Stylonychia lemnae]|eukprot:CDW82463.1 protein kinase domain containing protein [Stylonychia lemnae]